MPQEITDNNLHQRQIKLGVITISFELAYSPKECSECKACMLKCSFVRENEYNLKLARLNISGKWPDEPKLTICRQCAVAKCIAVCPTGALAVRDGIVILDENLCTQCGACIDACPFDAVHEFRNRIIKCDTCDGTYPCTTVCSTLALRKRGEK